MVRRAVCRYEVSQVTPKQGMKMIERAKRLLWVITACVTLFSLWQLERERRTVDVTMLSTKAGPMTVYENKTGAQGPMVLVSHGFAGSRQMMQYIARDLARAGLVVVSFDYIGHGRNTARLSRDVTRIEGTTQQLVDQTLAAFATAEDVLGPQPRAAVLGHSMATDIIIRAARDVPQVQDVVGISMYSDAVTPTFPERLLVISGEWEQRLRDAGREVMAQVSGVEMEGETVQSGAVTRRAVYAPNTEHVAVLFDSTTLAETRRWLTTGFGLPEGDAPRAMGPYILLALTGVVILTAPLLRLLPKTAPPAKPVTRAVFMAAVVLPVVPAGLASVYFSSGLYGVSSFAGLCWFFAVWGLVSCLVLLRAGRRFAWPSIIGAGVFLVWALIVFAVVLDRYGAAFMPTGVRLWLMVTLVPATLFFMLADRALAAGAPPWRRIVARALPVLTLSGAMVYFPQNLGLLFTVLPVLVLFFVVYGSMGTLVARRCGPETAAVAQAVVLAWSLAASTPLFAA